MIQNRTASINSIRGYVKNHWISLGLFLAAYGSFYIAVVIMSGWTLSACGKDVFDILPSAIYALLPRSLISPIFFITSLPALLVGTLILCIYSMHELRSGLTVDSERVAIILTMFGFAYQILGAWPLGKVSDFPWDWQKQIMSYGPLFAWTLYLLSLLALVMGGVLLFAHSRAYHRIYPEL